MSKRIISILCVFCLLFTGALGRVGYIIFSGDYSVSIGYNSYTLNLGKLYPTIYDRNLDKITNKNNKYIAVIRPTEKCLSELENLFSFKEIKEIKKELQKGYPVIKEINNYKTCKHIQIFEVVERNENKADILTKTIQSYNNDVIGKKEINFTVDAKGRLLEGDKGTVLEENYDSLEGICLTIDDKIQNIVEESAKNMNKGSVIVLDANTNDILASYSVGNDNINRSFTPYCVGSVFKLVVTAAALENDINLKYDCSGSIVVGDTTFSCQKGKAHGSEDLKYALANSCNCYFVKLALELGSDKILEMANKLGFGDKTIFCNDWEISNGNLPSKSVLQSKGQLSLLGFGQGSLTATPLQFASVVSAFANGGYYIEPTLICGNVDYNKNLIKTKSPNRKKVMSSKTAKTVSEFMRYVVTNGTGRIAEYNNNSAGKTSTAQSGRYVDQKEILNTWFAGFYPYNNPKYTIVVMTEDGKSGAGDCCPIYRAIVEKLDNI